MEDERMIREMISLDLQDEGLAVTTAVDGEEAIERIQQSPPDLILLDLLMPRKDGFGVLQFLRDNGYNVPVVILTNLSSPNHEKTCRELGAKDFVVKSELDTGDLWGRVKKYLS